MLFCYLKLFIDDNNLPLTLLTFFVTDRLIGIVFQITIGLIAELDEKDKTIVFGMIETMLTKKKFKDFFNKYVAML